MASEDAVGRLTAGGYHMLGLLAGSPDTLPWASRAFMVIGQAKQGCGRSGQCMRYPWHLLFQHGGPCSASTGPAQSRTDPNILLVPQAQALPAALGPSLPHPPGTLCSSSFKAQPVCPARLVSRSFLDRVLFLTLSLSCHRAEAPLCEHGGPGGTGRAYGALELQGTLSAYLPAWDGVAGVGADHHPAWAPSPPVLGLGPGPCCCMWHRPGTACGRRRLPALHLVPRRPPLAGDPELFPA